MPDEPHWIEQVRSDEREAKAAEAAHRRAITGPSRPRTATKSDGESAYARAALERESEAVAQAIKGTREETVNAALLSLGRHIAAGKLNEGEVRREIERACYANGFIQDDYGNSAERFWKRKGNRSLSDGISKGARDYSRVGTQTAPEPNVQEVDDITGGKRKRRRVKPDEPEEDSTREVSLKFLNTVKSQVPVWVWKIEDIGAIQLGRLVLFAGRSGAGKSTATRWLAAQISNGELPGAWLGHPMNVALFCGEEDTETAVINSLDVHGADRSRVAVTFVKDGADEIGLRIVPDEQLLVKQLIDNDIRCLIVDPVMDTLSIGSDPNSQLDVRRVLSAYNRIAKAINGIVVGVAHLRKPNFKYSDVRNEITGSAAWVEAVRHTITFANIPTSEGLRIMQITKNSAGPENDAWNYRLQIEPVITDEGLSYDTTRFDVLGRSLITIDEIGTGADDSDLFLHHVRWLREYLENNGPRPSADIKKDARKEMSESTLHRARRKLKCDIRYRTHEGITCSWWGLPGVFWND